MKKCQFLFLCVLLSALLISCTPGANGLEGTSPGAGDPAGFLMGIWHGAISFFTFILSLFNKEISVYEVHNNGGWYNFGFIMGILMAYGGSGRGAGCGKRRR